MQIKEIDTDKYVVLKRDDLDKYIGSTGMDRSIFGAICNKIEHLRKKEGKSQNKYLVLNLDDEIDLDCFGDALFGDDFDEEQKVKVKDIAVTLVNAILKAKEEQKCK